MRPKKVILCVNDDSRELSVSKTVLEVHGYRVLAAESGQEAMALLAMAKCVDLIIGAAEMPFIAGVALAERLKRIRSYVPIILVTRGGVEQAQILGAGADAIVSSRIVPIELLERVKVMCARKRGPRKGAQRVVPESALEIIATAS